MEHFKVRELVDYLGLERVVGQTVVFLIVAIHIVENQQTLHCGIGSFICLEVCEIKIVLKSEFCKLRILCDIKSFEFYIVAQIQDLQIWKNRGIESGEVVEI